MTTLRVVMDTSVLVSALRSNAGASYRFLQQIEQQRLQLLLTPALLLEYESVLKRPEQMEIHKLSFDEVDARLRRLEFDSKQVVIRRQFRPQLSDPEDEHVFEAAANGFANALVTHNVADFFPAALLFRIPVVRPADMISIGRLI